MPLNLIKQYPQLLEIMHLELNPRNLSLRRIFNRDIEENIGFSYNGKIIRPVKVQDGISSMDTVFTHLTTEDFYYTDENDVSVKKREFERDRSERLHWVRHCIEAGDLISFSVEERDQVKRKDIIRTYIYDENQNYVIVLEPQNSGLDYYLITAYHLNKAYGVKQMKKKYKKRLPEIH